jgi:D-alanyl-D-alanine endopeptidase (penicillin-binding protein 7)
MVLAAGESYTVKDLLELMLLPSNNQAAEVVAGHYGRVEFVRLMNAKAAEWGMNQTHYAEPTGLSVSNQSTASDLARMMSRVYALYPAILQISRGRKATITEINSGKKTEISSINNFAGRADFLGGKTGFTDEAQGNLISLFSYQNRPLAIIVMGTDDRFGDTEKLLSWFKENFKTQ